MPDLLRAEFICEKWQWPAYRAEELVRLQLGENGKYLESASWRIIKQRDGLLVVKNDPLRQEACVLSQEDVIDGKCGIIGEFVAPVVDTSLPMSTILVDAAKLQFPLTYRPWQQGD